MFSVYSEVGSMKTGDYMIHVSNHLHLFLVLNDLTLMYLIRFTSLVARISSAMTGKLPFSDKNLMRFRMSNPPDHIKYNSKTFQNLIRLNFTHFSDTINPVITVDVCGETKYTTAKKDVSVGTTTPANWREHLFFEPRNRVSSASIFAQFFRQRLVSRN